MTPATFDDEPALLWHREGRDTRHPRQDGVLSNGDPLGRPDEPPKARGGVLMQLRFRWPYSSAPVIRPMLGHVEDRLGVKLAQSGEDAHSGEDGVGLTRPLLRLDSRGSGGTALRINLENVPSVRSPLVRFPSRRHCDDQERWGANGPQSGATSATELDTVGHSSRDRSCPLAHDRPLNLTAPAHRVRRNVFRLRLVTPPTAARSGRSSGSAPGMTMPESQYRPRPGLLDYPEAAGYLGTTERHVRRLWQERRLTGVRVGRKVRFRQIDLDLYVESQRVEAVR